MAFMHGIPNTVQYWVKRKKDLFAMIRQLGKPTAFLTLSASEVYWPDLLELLQKLKLDSGEIGVSVEEMNCMYRAQLVNEDPVVCSIYFDKLVRVILNILRDKRISPFRPYCVVDYFKRIEFQHRGSARAHILLWLQNAPNEELSMQMPATLEMASVLLSLNSEQLRRPRTQIHQHTHTCYKHNSTKCRFNAPFMPIDEAMVVVPFPATDNEAQKIQHERLRTKYNEMHQALETTHYDSMEQFFEHHGVKDIAQYISILRAGIPRPTLMLPRTVTQKSVNYFNPWIASVLDSNMDLQIVLDTYACAAYVVEYVNKANRGMSNLHRAVHEIVKEKGDQQMKYTEALRHLGVKMLNAIEISAQEAAWCLLKQDMSESSRKVVFVNTAWPEERTRIRKTTLQMENEGLDDSSTDVWKRTMIERYEDRPPELENITLAQFATQYNIYTYSKRVHTLILRSRGYSVDDDVNFRREQVLLFHPFSREVDILDNNRFEQIYQEHLESILVHKARYHSNVDIDQLRSMCNTIVSVNNTATTTDPTIDKQTVRTICRDKRRQ